MPAPWHGAAALRWVCPPPNTGVWVLWELTALLLSMTGYGAANYEDGGMAVAVEVRSINSRYFKLTVRVSEGYSALEPRVESLVRQFIRRGTVQATVDIQRLASPEDFAINVSVLRQYWTQLGALCGSWGLSKDVPLHALLCLPGVVGQSQRPLLDVEPLWAAIEPTVAAALEKLEQMRRAEGQAMEADLRRNCRLVAAAVEAISRRAPEVAETYRLRLEERVKKVLAELQAEYDPADLVREVSIVAERSDIAEEIVRLQSHLEQFNRTMQSEQSSGRKLEFLLQEMYREANTIGSKSPDMEIIRQVIEIKAAVERMREMVQNVE